MQRILVVLAVVLTVSCGGGPGNSFVAPPPPPPQPPPPPPPVFSAIPMVQLSADPFTNAASQHATEVEPHAYAVGTTIVAAFQVGRRAGGSAAAIGFAISRDAGATWSNGLVPSITQFQNGPWAFVSDPVVAYDAAHQTWLISTLGVSATTSKILVSRSADGANWSNPVEVSATPQADKNWTVCDNTASSPFFGHCYTQWDDPTNEVGLIWMSTSTDGGATWQTGRQPANDATGIGGQPMVLPSGKVVVPILNDLGDALLAFSSDDGGDTWRATRPIATVVTHRVGGNLRALALPTAQVDATGNVFVVWQDCRFRATCVGNDLVMTRSTDGENWTSPMRIPINIDNQNADYFLPTLAIDGTVSGVARMAISYYFYPTSACDATTCRLHAAVVTSLDGNAWSAPVGLAGPMPLDQLAATNSGPMVGDYFGTVFANGLAFPVITVALAKNGTVFNEAIYTARTGIDPARSSAAVAMRAERVLTTRSPEPIRPLQEEQERKPRRFPPSRR
jgi:hypothetical protein